MFHKLHIQLTLFCTFVTGCIFLVLTFLCLLFAENNLKAEDNAAFLRQLNAALIHLQDQDLISHQWLNQIQKNSQFLLYLYDNGKPLYYQQYHDSVQEKLLREEAVRQTAEEQNLDIFSEQPDRVILHTEFDFQSSNGRKYYASAGVIPKPPRLSHSLPSPGTTGQDPPSAARYPADRPHCHRSSAGLFLVFYKAYDPSPGTEQGTADPFYRLCLP